MSLIDFQQPFHTRASITPSQPRTKMNTKPIFRIAPKLAIAVWLLATGAAPAQTAVQAWVQRYGPRADSIDSLRGAVSDNAGNVIVAGYTDEGLTGPDLLTIKYSGAGVALWTNRYDGPGHSFDQATALAVDGAARCL